MFYIIFFNEVVTNLWEASIILLLFTYIAGKRDFIPLNKFKTVFFVVAYSVFIYAANQSFYSYATLITFIFVTAILCLLTNINIYNSLLITAIILIFFTLVDVSSILVFAAINNLKLPEATANPMMKMYIILVSKTFETLLVSILYLKGIKLSRINIFKKENSALSYVILQATVFVIIFISVIFMAYNTVQETNQQILIALLSLLFLVFIFIGYKDIERVFLLDNKFKLQEEYVKNLELVVDAIRRERHDFANHLSTLKAICTLRAEDTVIRIDSYLQKLTNNLTASCKFYSTGNNYIDGLLAVKSGLAAEKGINLDVGFDVLLTEIDVDDIDLTSIIGNIVDNGFEAIEESGKNKGGIVAIYSYSENGRYYIAISNNGMKIPENNLDKIFENKFSTKTTKNKSQRGFGLFITKQLVQKHKGRIHVTSDENETEFLIEFKTKKSKLKEDLPASEINRLTM